jgi:hypothetical protein
VSVALVDPVAKEVEPGGGAALELKVRETDARVDDVGGDADVWAVMNSAES